MDVDKLISEVFIRNALWDQKDKNHHNRFVLDKKWDEVAEQLNTTRAVARNKWKSLRDKFRTTLAAIQKPKSGDPATPNPKYTGEWKYFQSLLFLKDQFTPRRHGGNFATYAEEDENAILPAQNFEDEENLDPHEGPQVIEELSQSNELPELATPRSTSSSSRPASANDNHANISMKRKRFSNTDIGPALLEIENRKIQHFEEKTKRAQIEEDDDLAFFKSLLPYVKTLSSFDKMSYRVAVKGITQSYIKQVPHKIPQQVTQLNSQQDTERISYVVTGRNKDSTYVPANNTYVANRNIPETSSARLYYNNCQIELENPSDNSFVVNL